MARKRNNDEISLNSGSIGYSKKALDALARGTYKQDFAQNRNQQYRTSQEQTQPSKKLPVLEGMTRSPEWESSFSRKNYVDTDRARRNYAEKYMNERNQKPSTKYDNPSAGNMAKASNRDTSFDKDFEDFYEWRYNKLGVTPDYDPLTDTNVEHWQKVKKDIMAKNQWTEKEFDERWDAYDKERSQKMADEEVSNAIEYAKENPISASILAPLISMPQTWIEGGASMLEGASSYLGKLTGWNPLEKYTPESETDPQFTALRAKEGVKEEVKKNINSTLGKKAYDAATGVIDLPGGALGMGAQNAASTHMRKLANGADKDKAAQTALGAGLVSYVTNKYGLGKAANSNSLGKAALIEGLENVIEDAGTTAVDIQTNGKNSDLGALYNYYISQGMSPTKAAAMVAKDTAIQEGTSFGMGALMGGSVNALNNLPRLKESYKSKQNVGIADSSMSQFLTDVLKKDEVNIDGTDYAVNKANKSLVDANGKEVPLIDPTVFDTSKRGTPEQTKRQFAADLTKYIKDNFVGKKFTVKDNGREIGFIGESANEFAGSKSSFRKNNKNMGLKANIAPRLQSVIENAFFNHHENNVESYTPMKDRGVDKYDISLAYPTEDGIKLYDATMDVGLHKDGNDYFYDILKIEPKKKADTQLLSNDSVTDISRPSSDNSIIQNEGEVNGGTGFPAVNGVIPEGGKNKTSKYYENTMRNTPTNAEMSDAEYGSRFDRDEYGYIPSSHKDVDAKSNQFIQESGGEDGAINRLLNEEFENEETFDNVHIDAAMKLADKIEREAKALEASGQDATEQWMLANKLHKKIRENGTMHAKGLEILKKWKQSTPQGQIDYIVTEVNKSVDNHKTKGYTKMVNRMADDVEDVILNGGDKKTVTENIKKVFENNRKSSDYNTEGYEQLVLDLVGGEDFGHRSPASIAEEAGALIKQKMGVSSLTARQERSMLDLFEKASHYPENSRAYNECISQAMTILDSTLPSSLGDKAKSVLYDNMLSSVKTMLTRNLGGNVLGNAVETASKPLQVLADVAASKVTGNRTRTLTGKSIVEGAKGFKQGVKDWGLDVWHNTDTTRSGQNSLEDSLKAVHKTFKTQSKNKAVQGINKVLGGYDRIVRKGMELGDRPIYEMRYAATKAELLDLVDRFGDEGLRKGLPGGRDISTDELIELIAVNDGLEAVLQNDSTMKKGAQALKKAIGLTSEDILGVDIATMSTTPFVEVPANMASRFFQYTPFGVIGNTARSIKEKSKYGAVNQRRMTGEAGRNALGTLMTAGAMGLASNNFISDPYSEDKDEKKLQQNNDYLEYALQTPDGERQIDLSDIPVLGPMLRYGKMQYDAYKDGGIPELLANIPNAAGSATIDTLYQGLNKLTGGSSNYSSGDSMMSNAKNAITSSVGSMFTPALVRQTAQFLDPYKRDLGDFGTSEYNKNLIINGLPILREMMLNPKVGTSGEPVKQNGGEAGAGKFLNTYLWPWKVSTPKENMSEAQKYAESLKLQTGGIVNPQSQVFNAKDLKGIKGYDAENYTHDDLYKLDNELYKSNDKLATSLIHDDWFKSLAPEKQGRYLDALYSNNKEVIKEKFVRDGMTPEEIEKAGDSLYTADDRLAKILKEDDDKHTGMMKYFHNVDGIENLEKKYGYKMDYDTYEKWNTEDDKKALGGAEKYAEVHDKATALNMTVENYLKAQKDYVGGAEQKAADIQEAKDLGFVNKDGGTNLKSYQTAIETVGDNPNKIAFYQNYKSQKFEKGTNEKVPYVMNSPLSNEERAKLITNTTDPSKLTGAGISGAYKAGGWDGVWYWRQAQYLADTKFGNGNGSVSKDEKNALLNAVYNYEYMEDMPDEMYNYLLNVPNKQW